MTFGKGESEIHEQILDINFRTVAKAMGGRTTGQIGVRGLASEKKVRIGDEDNSALICHPKFYGTFNNSVIYVIQALQAVQVGFGEIHPPQCPNCWKGGGFSIWSV